MFPAAQIYHDNRENPVTLVKLMEHLQATLGGSYELVEWQGFTTTIPQLQINGELPWTLQIEADPEYVPEEIEEMAEGAEGVLPAEDLERLRRCNALLAAMASRDQQLPDISGGSIVVVASTSLDPSDQEVRKVLLQTAELVSGLAYDLTEGEWIRGE